MIVEGAYKLEHKMIMVSVVGFCDGKALSFVCYTLDICL